MAHAVCAYVSIVILSILGVFTLTFTAFAEVRDKAGSPFFYVLFAIFSSPGFGSTCVFFCGVVLLVALRFSFSFLLVVSFISTLSRLVIASKMLSGWAKPEFSLHCTYPHPFQLLCSFNSLHFSRTACFNDAREEEKEEKGGGNEVQKNKRRRIM
jgi:hypothetical protein